MTGAAQNRTRKESRMTTTPEEEPAGISKAEAGRSQEEGKSSLARLAGRVSMSAKRARETPPVAVAVITSSLGVLVGRRSDGTPPWTFPGGKVEPGENALDAAVRETSEETGLRIRAIGIIGSRVHRATGVLVTYVAAVPEGEQEAQAARDLAEVRWVSAAEADELTGGAIFEPVGAHLRQALGD